MVWWMRDVVWTAETPVVQSGLGTRSAVRQVRGRPRCTRCLIICKAPASIGRPRRSAWTSSVVRSCPSFLARRWATASLGWVGFTPTTHWPRSLPGCGTFTQQWRPSSHHLMRCGAPVSQEWDLAFTAFAWVPLHARHVVLSEGFTAFADRPRRLRLFLDTYGWDGQLAEFVSTVQARVTASAEGIRRTAAAGDPAYQTMLDAGVDASLRTAVYELEGFRSHLDT